MCVAAEWRNAWGLMSGTAGLSGRSVYDVTGYALVDTAASCAEEQGVGSTGLDCIRCRTGQYRPPLFQPSLQRTLAGSPNGTTRCLLPLPVTLMVRLEKSMSAISIDTSSATRMPVAYSSSRIAALRCDSAVTRACRACLRGRVPHCGLRYRPTYQLSCQLPCRCRARLPLPHRPCTGLLQRHVQRHPIIARPGIR